MGGIILMIFIGLVSEEYGRKDPQLFSSLDNICVPLSALGLSDEPLGVCTDKMVAFNIDGSARVTLTINKNPFTGQIEVNIRDAQRETVEYLGTFGKEKPSPRATPETMLNSPPSRAHPTTPLKPHPPKYSRPSPLHSPRVAHHRQFSLNEPNGPTASGSMDNRGGKSARENLSAKFLAVLGQHKVKIKTSDCKGAKRYSPPAMKNTLERILPSNTSLYPSGKHSPKTSTFNPMRTSPSPKVARGGKGGSFLSPGSPNQNCSFTEGSFCPSSSPQPPKHSTPLTGKFIKINNCYFLSPGVHALADTHRPPNLNK